MKLFTSLLTSDMMREASDAYHRAKPFPHVILNNWFHPDALNSLECEFDHPLEDWRRYEGKKRGLMTVVDHPFVKAMIDGSGFRVVQAISRQPALCSDPTLRGGGLHVIEPGGRLGIHVDFNRHPDLPLKRTVNTLLYLNRDWDPAWQGELTLTDQQETHVSVQPIWNRWVIFEYGPTAWHGHPQPLACPPDRERRSLAVYYYTPLADLTLPFHTTIYADRPA